MTQRPSIRIYTDGACTGNPGPGGYGVVILNGGKRRELAGGYDRTTNNRMEMMAVIVGLEELATPANVILYSDSKYIVDAVNKGWAKKWRANKWMRNKYDKALNPDLWDRLLKAIERHSVDFKWVRGHSGVIENERCDRLATSAAAKPGLPVDRGYVGK